MSALIYTPEIVAFIQSHWNIDMKGRDIAIHIGVTYAALKKHVNKLRDRGVYFAEKQYNKPADIGEIRRQSHGGRIHLMQKNEAGEWKYVGESKRSNPITKSKPQPQPMPRARSMRKAPEKPKEIKRTTLTDTEKIEKLGYQWVWINRNTKVLRSPDKINQP